HDAGTDHHAAQHVTSHARQNAGQRLSRALSARREQMRVAHSERSAELMGLLYAFRAEAVARELRALCGVAADFEAAQREHGSRADEAFRDYPFRLVEDAATDLFRRPQVVDAPGPLPGGHEASLRVAVAAQPRVVQDSLLRRIVDLT